MSSATKIIFLSITLICVQYVQCDVTMNHNAVQRDAVYHKVNELKERGQKLYGNVTLPFRGWQGRSDDIGVSRHIKPSIPVTSTESNPNMNHVTGLWRFNDTMQSFIRGGVALEHLDSNPKVQKKKYEFKCHILKNESPNLSAISNQWTDYYECCARSLDRLTIDNTYPAVSVAAFQGAPARLRCDLCIAPDERGNVTWSYTKSLSNPSYIQLEEDERIVRERDNAITIYNAREQDGGVYRCEMGDSASGPVVLEVADYEESYTVVKPHTSNGPYPAPESILNDELVTLTVWEPWSACSACGTAGRKERRGMCFVAGVHSGKHPIFSRQLTLNDTIRHRDESLQLTQAERLLFNLFPSGIFCRSRYLPPRLRNATAVQNRTSEIMIGLCKERCKHTIFKLMQNGRVLEEANNTAGIFSLAQTIPPPVLVERDIVFVNNGDPVILRCPGTVARDIPLTWTVGDKRIVPLILDRESGGRVRVNARGHIVFTAVRDEDDNLYSCRMQDTLAGRVRLRVWNSRRN